MIPALIILALQGCVEKSDWELSWSEEFNVSGSPAVDKWDYEIGHIRNRELQYYTSARENVWVEEGVCTITARVEAADSITSASINTRGKQEFLYGRMEVRAQIPSALGTWPAIWMLGTNMGEVGWPACGEIDIMEHVGYDPSVIHANIHTDDYNHTIGTGKGNHIEMADPWSDFHVYAVEWFENRLDFFMDDSLYFSFENDMTGNNATWPFDKPHYLLINLAYGGGWGGRQGVDPSQLPVDYKIDYVRYYQSKK